MKLNQKGFSIVEGLLIVVGISLIGCVGFYVYSAQKDTNRSLDNASSTNKTIQLANNQKASTKPIQNKNPGYLTISEWGVAARIGATSNSDKLAYRIAKDDYGDDTAYFLLAETVSTKCRDVGFALHRKTGSDSSKYTKIGTAYYAPSAAPSSLCDKQTGEEKAIELLGQLTASIDKYDYEFKASK